MRTFRRRACDVATVWISRSIGRRWTDGREPISSSASNDRPNRTTDGWQDGSGLIMLARHPRPDVRGTVPKHNTPAEFVLSQDTDGVTIGEHQIGKIQHQDTAGRLCIDYLAQLVHAVGAKLTADREHNRSTAGAMNFQHRPRRSERNCQAIWKVPERAGVSQK